jgi:hypothetical protein
LDFHSVFAVASLRSLWAALSALWMVHVAVMVVYFLRLLVASGIRPPLRTIVLACYVFSMPSAFLFYQTDWVSVIVGWTLFPALVFYVHRAVVMRAARPSGQPRRASGCCRASGFSTHSPRIFRP